MSVGSNLLEKAVEKKIALGCADRNAALEDISLSIEIEGLYGFAKMFGLLHEGSAEEFAVAFMGAFNNECRVKY